MDVDLQKFLPIPYNTAQAGIGGDFRKLLHFPFIPHTTKNLKTAKLGRRFLFARPPRIAFRFANSKIWFPLFTAQYWQISKTPNFSLIFFTNKALAAFLSARILKKWAQKNRKPFLDFLFRCAAVMGGGYFIFSYRSSWNFIWLSISLVLI